MTRNLRTGSRRFSLTKRKQSRDRRPLPRYYTNLFRLSRYLCNTSGSGKTRLLLEGLHRHWGFYFTACNSPDGVGSSDLGLALKKLDDSLIDITPGNGEIIKRENKLKAEHTFLAVLCARVTIFRVFVECALELDLVIASQKHSWLLLQLQPKSFFGTDIFHELARDMGRGSDLEDNHERGSALVALREQVTKELEEVKALLDVKRLSCIFDEAQGTTDLHTTCFRSDADPNQPRPVIRSLVDTFSVVDDIIISGTGLSIRTLKSALSTVVAKDGGQTITVTGLGAFNCEADHRAYLSRYLPHNFLDTSSGKRLLRRIGFWLHGRYVEAFTFMANADPSVRHRFTALYLSHLLAHSLEAPHRTLDDFIEGMTHFRPSDAADVVEKPRNTKSLISKMDPSGFHFEKLKDSTYLPSTLACHSKAVCPDQRLLRTIAVSVLEYIFTGQPRSLGGPDTELLVEHGFARFYVQQEGIADEPLALLAATHYFSLNTPWTLQHLLLDSLTETKASPRGFAFQFYGSYMLAAAFQSWRKLSSVFTFIGKTPLQNESARLVAVNKQPRSVSQVHPVSFDRRTGPHYILGHSPTSQEETLSWMENPKGTAFCFPEEHVGPDLILLLELSSGGVLRVLVQYKHHSNKSTITPLETEDAFRTTDPAKFISTRDKSEPAAGRSPPPRYVFVFVYILCLFVSYNIHSHSVAKQNAEMNRRLRRALLALAPCTDLAGSDSVLRVMIAYPAKANIARLDFLIKNDPARHPGAVVDLTKLASCQAEVDIFQSLRSMANCNIQRRSAKSSTNASKRKVGDEQFPPRKRKAPSHPQTGTANRKQGANVATGPRKASPSTGGQNAEAGPSAEAPAAVATLRRSPRRRW